MRGRPKAQLVLSESEREQLMALTMRRKTAQALALRARIVLACAQGVDNKIVAARQRVTPQTVSKWRARFVEQRLDGLLDEPRPGAPRSIDDARVDAVIAKTLESVPPGRHPLEHAHHGARNGRIADGGDAHLARLRLAAAPPGDLQAVQRSVVRREGARHRRAVPGPAATRRWCCAWTRRARSRRSIARSPSCRWPRASRAAHPRLHAPRHHDAVRGAGHRHRRGHRSSCTGAIAAPSSCSSCAPSRPMCPASWTCI